MRHTCTAARRTSSIRTGGRRLCLVTAFVCTACTGHEGTHDYPIEVITADQLLHVEPVVDFASVRSTVSTRDGTWVLDRATPFLTFIAHDPARVTAFGAEGEGPGELRTPVAIQATDEGVDVWDIGRKEVVRFDRTGHVVGTRRLSEARGGWIRPDMAEVSYLDPWRVRRLADDLVYARFPDGLTHPAEAAGGALISTIGEATSWDTLVDYAELIPGGPDARGQFVAIPLWDACDDTLVIWDPRHSVVRWYDADGRDFASVPVALRPPPITEAGVVRFLRHMARLEIGPAFESAGIDFPAMARGLRTEFGDRGPAIADVRCAAPGVAWLQLFDMSDDPLGRGSTWIRTGPETAPKAVVFPDHFRPTEFGTDSGRDVLLGSNDTGSGQTLSVWRTANPHST